MSFFFYPLINKSINYHLLLVCVSPCFGVCFYLPTFVNLQNNFYSTRKEKNGLNESVKTIKMFFNSNTLLLWALKKFFSSIRKGLQRDSEWRVSGHIERRMYSIEFPFENFCFLRVGFFTSFYFHLSVPYFYLSSKSPQDFQQIPSANFRSADVVPREYRVTRMVFFLQKTHAPSFTDTEHCS